MQVKYWPFVETPGEFSKRLETAMSNSINILAAVRTVLIEQPPEISITYLEKLEKAKANVR